MEKNFILPLVAQNATETVKTLIGSYTIPQGVSRLVEVGAVIHMAGMTTLEGVGGILEVESADSPSWTTQQFVLDQIIPLTSGLATIKPTIHDVNIPVVGGAHLDFSTTLNMAMTITPSIRCFGKFV